ncbi:MAG TPA: alkaline phosphatase family protein, partial [Ktedonobacteraceae bacterium]|nr:alkaline phosphatase family protein [Ktedonobacteraceae bacterium]
MSQVLLIGISGLDADLLRVYGPSLPNLRRLMLESPFLDLNSTIPPEPVPAWGSVYTGLNPANHGMLASMDCLERTIPETQHLQDELFWETAARAGKRVCVLNPLLSTPQPLTGLTLVPPTPCPAQD